MPKFKSRWYTRYDPKTGKSEKRTADAASEVVRFAVDSTYSERGELEDMTARIGRIVNVLACMADALPDDKQKEVVELLGWETT